MLAIYDNKTRNARYEKFCEEKIKEMICPLNNNHMEIIRDIMMDYMKTGNFDVELVIDDIRVINNKISEEIAQVAIEEGVAIGYWNDDDDFFQFLVETADDIIDSIFLSQDLMIAIQEMVYETARKYNLPLMMKKGLFFEYPEILQMYCKKGESINALPDDIEVYVHSNHAQGVMFDELLDNEPTFYGRDNILIYDEKEIEKSANLLEG